MLVPDGSHAALRRFVYPDGHLGWIVGSYELARAVLADTRFSSRAELKRVPVHRPGADPFLGQEVLPGWFVDMDPPDHTVYRRLVASYFTLHRMKRLRPRIAQIVDARLTEMQARGGPVDLVDTFALPTALQVLCELLGVPLSERERIRAHRETLFSLEATSAEGVLAMQALTDLMLELIRLKEDQPADDLLSGVARTGELTHIELAGVGVLLLTAGHDTVASMLALGTLTLLLHPDQLAGIGWDSPAIDDTIEELLRYLSIFHLGVPRSPVEDIEIGGQLIRAGESVTVAIPSANHDPQRFANPGELNLSRAEGGNLTFGHGIHQCIGQNLARIQMRVGYPALFRRFPTLRLATSPEEIVVVRDGAIYSLHELPVTW